MNELAAARLDAIDKRQRFIGTLHQLQEQLRPAVIAQGVVDGAKARSWAILENAREAVRRRPVAFSVIAISGVVLLSYPFLYRTRRNV